MQRDVIFEITKDHLERGLHDIPVGYSSTSYIDPQKGLFYVGRSLNEIYSWDPLRVIFLLYRGREAAEKELMAFAEYFDSISPYALAAIETVKKMDPAKDPILLFAMAIAFLEKIPPLELLAAMPAIAAGVICHCLGCDPGYCKNLGPWLEDFACRLNIPSGNRPRFTDFLRLFINLYVDRGAGFLPAFAAKAAYSGRCSIPAALSCGLLAFSGERLGEPIAECYRLISQFNKGAIAFIDVFKTTIEEGRPLPGFGNLDFKGEDMRANIFYNYAEKYFAKEPLVVAALQFKTEASAFLKEHTRIRNPNPNADAIAGALLSACGFDQPRFFPLLSAMAGSMGIIVQLLHEDKKAKVYHPYYFYRSK